MIGRLRNVVDALRGCGEAAPSVPSMDGALRPNVLLESKPEILKIAAPDNLAKCGHAVVFSSGRSLLSLDAESGRAQQLREFQNPIASLATYGEIICVALTDGSLWLIREGSEMKPIASGGGRLPACPTAMTLRDASTLIVCQGSARNPPGGWNMT